MVSLSDFTRGRNPDLSQSTSLGNVHLKIEDYGRAPNGVMVANGTDLRTGQEMSIALAGVDEFVKLYTHSDEDIGKRRSGAEKVVANRPTLSEYSSKRGNKAVPKDGVVTFTDVRPDYDSGQLYARWLQGMVHIPGAETALKGTFEVRSRLGKDNSGKEFTAHTINFIDTNRSIDLSASADPRSELDSILSGQLPTTKDAPVRTGVMVSAKIGDEVGSWSVSSPREMVGEGANKQYVTVPGIDALLNRKHNDYAAVPATILAARAGRDFDSLTFDLKNAGMMDSLRGLYDGVKNGSIRVAVTPTAQFSPSRFQNNALQGIKVAQDGSVKEARTPETNLVGRGYFDGVVGVRFEAQSNGNNTIIEPVVKAIASDERLPAQSSDKFQKMDLRAVGERVMEALAEPAPSPEHLLNVENDDDEHDFGFDNAPSF